MKSLFSGNFLSFRFSCWREGALCSDVKINGYYLVKNIIITKHFSDQLFDQLKTECSSHDLTINVAMSKIIRFNPLKRNIDMPLFPFSILNEMKILGVTLNGDYHFSAHINSTVHKANACLQTLTKLGIFGVILTAFSIPTGVMFARCSSTCTRCEAHLLSARRTNYVT